MMFTHLDIAMHTLQLAKADPRDPYNPEGVEAVLTAAEATALWTELERMNNGLRSALAELHHHFGCDEECEKRHPDEPAFCPHGVLLKANVCGPCSKGRPNRSAA